MQSIKSEIPNFPRKFVYFEKQSNDRLCGLHCLNNLLQGPYFDIVMLSEIGLELDKIERELTGGHYSQNNVDDDGNYGIQVLQKALKLYGADLTPLKKRQAISYIEQNGIIIEALIFNSSTHWFAIRKINDIWFNLNSTNSLPGPEIITDFYLSAFIQGAEDVGYTNFLVSNLPKLPELDGQMYSNLQNYQYLVKFEDIIKAKELKNAAIKEREMEQKKKEEEAKKFKAFTGKGYSVDEEHVLDVELHDDEDDEMEQAMKLSLEEFAKSTLKELPPEPKEGGFNIIVSYNGKSFWRRFNDNDKIKHIIMFAKSQIPTFSHISLFEAFPVKNYDDEDKTLVEAGLGRNQLLMCKLLN